MPHQGPNLMTITSSCNNMEMCPGDIFSYIFDFMMTTYINDAICGFGKEISKEATTPAQKMFLRLIRHQSSWMKASQICFIPLSWSCYTSSRGAGQTYSWLWLFCAQGYHVAHISIGPNCSVWCDTYMELWMSFWWLVQTICPLSELGSMLHTVYMMTWKATLVA